MPCAEREVKPLCRARRHSDQRPARGSQIVSDRRFVVSGAAAGGTAPDRSRACAGDVHQACGHVAFASPPVPGHRAESTIMLCRCSCHRACALGRRTETIAATVWQRCCTCPGAEHERTSHADPGHGLPGFEEFWAAWKTESRQRSEAHKEAFEAARSVASGMTGDEIRDLYIAELRARGLEIPSEPLLAAAVDVLSGHPRAGLGKIWTAALRTLTSG
jgi:hypothetical protein